MGIRTLINHKEINLNANLVQAVIHRSQIKQFQWIQYYQIFKLFWKELNGDYFKKCLKYKQFSQAIKCFVSNNIHNVTDFIVNFEDIPTINHFINLYLESRENGMQIEQRESEERILKSYYNAVGILNQVIKEKQDNNAIIHLVSLLVVKLKTYYIRLILDKYKIDKSFYQS